MKLPVITITQPELSRFPRMLEKEWLLTNGLGGYASSTVLGVNTRKYHGLLVSALQPPGDRRVCLAKLDEDVKIDNNCYSLGTNEFREVIYPQGYRFLRKFSIAPFPRYDYTVHNIEIMKTIFMPKRKNVIAAIYRIINKNDSKINVRIHPLLTCRHFHSVVDRAKNHPHFSQRQENNEVEITFSREKTTVALRASEGKFNEKPNWIERLYYRKEDERGESSLEDCYQPGYFDIPVSTKQERMFTIITAAGENSHDCEDILFGIGNSAKNITGLLELGLKQRMETLMRFYNSHRKATASDWLSWLLLASNAFIVNDVHNGKSVIAGYHWFEPWGRDTFVSLPGLMLITGRFGEARKVFMDFLHRCRNGLIPNRIGDKHGESLYNTVDATLWYVNAVFQYLKYTGDFKFVQKELWATLKMIVDCHMEGTDFGIGLDNDGLLTHGPQLTWMDAEVAGAPVTPRTGKAIEIQALWYNKLRILQLLAKKFNEKSLADTYAEMADEARASFLPKFWNDEKCCLFDVIGSKVDASVRPNQIIAVALDFSMLSEEQSTQVVKAVELELLTPFGLRTLSQADNGYKGVCSGNRSSRDEAYHNGTVWPWLLGPYATAVRKIKSNRDEISKSLLSLFTRQILRAGLGTVSEIFDGDPPHTPRGCIAQAWSVAEPLRAYVEDFLHNRPEFEL